MSFNQPRRLVLAAGLAVAVIGCASQPPAQPAAQAQPAKPAPTSAAPAKPAAPAPPAAQANAPLPAPGPTPPGRFNGTPAEKAGKPGTYMVLNGKPEKVPAVKMGDKSTVARIINEGKNNNHVMDHLTHITTKIGPRLTGSTNVETANKWAMEQFRAWGLESDLFEWGTIPVRFDRGPSTAKVGRMTDGEFRSSREMEFTTPAWAAGTNGPVCGQIIKMPETEAQYEAVKDKIKGSWILIKASGQGRRGVGPMAGGAAARQRFFAETRKKLESGELKPGDTKPAARAEVNTDAKPETKPETKAEPASAPVEGIAGAWEGTATGGRIPEGGAPFTLDLKLDGAAVTGTMSYTNYHSAPLKEGKWDAAAKTLTFVWEGPGGNATYTFALDGQALKGQSKRDDGSIISLPAKRAQAGKDGALKDTKPAPKPDSAAPAATGIAGNWGGTATGGPIPEGGVPFELEVKIADGNVSGSMGYPNYHSGPIKDAKWDEGTSTLTYSWESPAGATTYTFKLSGDSLKGDSKLPPDMNGPIVLSGKRAQPPKEPAKAAATDDPKTDDSESKGPSIDERVFLAGPAGYISASGDERVRTGGSYRNVSMDNLPKDCEIQVRSSDYDYMNSRVSDGGTIYAEIKCDHTFTAGPIKVYDTVAEIKGTQWPDEVVIVSAHLDSWNGPGSQGTTDNGTGSSVTLEAARILTAVGAKPKRTIRFILWTGEEQGLLGSRAYVKMLKEADKLKNISAVFVDDGGTNYEGGLHCIDSQVDFLGAATAPVNGVFWSSTDKRFLDVNIQPGRRMGGGISGGSSDHASFLAEKVPGYFWDEVGRADYGFGWHTQNDKLELAIPEYLIQSSTCAAVTAYNLACAPSLLPREPAPAKEDKKDTTASAPNP